MSHFLFPPWGFEFMAYYMLNKYSTSVGSQGITLHLMIVYQVSFDYDNFLDFFFLTSLDSHRQPGSKAWESTHSCRGSILSPLLISLYYPLLTVPYAVCKGQGV